MSTERETQAVLQHIAAAVDGLVRWVASPRALSRLCRSDAAARLANPSCAAAGEAPPVRSYKFRLHTQASDLAALRAEWDELLDHSDQCVFFLRWSWVHLWWQNYAPPHSRLYLLTCRDGTGRLVGLAPLYCQQRQFAGVPHIRDLNFLGTGVGIRISEYLDVFTRRGFEGPCAEVFAGFLLQRSDWDRLWLWSIPGRSKFLPHLKTALGITARAHLCDRSHRIDTANDWETAKRSWSRQFSHKIDRCTRILYNEYAAEFCRVETLAEVDPALNDLIRLHQMRWRAKGESGSFAYPKFEAFVRAAVPRAFQDGRLGFWTLKLRGQCAATLLAFIDNGVAHYFQSGFDMEYAKYSLGTVMFAQSIQACVSAPGIREFDFMGGDAAYKDSWTRDVRDAYELELLRPGARTLLYLTGQRTRRVLARARRLWRERFFHVEAAM